MNISSLAIFKSAEIELQSLCNRDCPFCNRYNDRSGAYKDEQEKPIKRSLPTEKVLDILDQLHAMKYEGPVTFSAWSEPFLDKRLITLAGEARKRGMRPYVNTNGDVLRNNGGLCQEAAEVFDMMVIGIYDYRDQNNIEREKEEWRQRLPKTELSFSVLDKKYILHNVNEAWFENSKSKAINAVINQPCSQPENRLIIRYDGEVMLCCEEMTGAFGLGNVFNDSIKGIWWSEKRAQIVATLKGKGGRKNYPFCRTCPRGYKPKNGFLKLAINKMKAAVSLPN